MNEISLFSGTGTFETEDENQMNFNDEKSFNKIVEECKKGSKQEPKVLNQKELSLR